MTETPHHKKHALEIAEIIVCICITGTIKTCPISALELILYTAIEKEEKEFR